MALIPTSLNERKVLKAILEQEKPALITKKGGLEVLGKGHHKISRLDRGQHTQLLMSGLQSRGRGHIQDWSDGDLWKRVLSVSKRKKLNDPYLNEMWQLVLQKGGWDEDIEKLGQGQPAPAQAPQAPAPQAPAPPPPAPPPQAPAPPAQDPRIKARLDEVLSENRKLKEENDKLRKEVMELRIYKTQHEEEEEEEEEEEPQAPEVQNPLFDPRVRILPRIETDEDEDTTDSEEDDGSMFEDEYEGVDYIVDKSSKKIYNQEFEPIGTAEWIHYAHLPSLLGLSRVGGYKITKINWSHPKYEKEHNERRSLAEEDVGLRADTFSPYKEIKPLPAEETDESSSESDVETDESDIEDQSSSESDVETDSSDIDTDEEDVGLRADKVSPQKIKSLKKGGTSITGGHFNKRVFTMLHGGELVIPKKYVDDILRESRIARKVSNEPPVYETLKFKNPPIIKK